MKRVFENLLGIHRISEWSNEDLIAASNAINEKYRHTNKSYVNVPQGLTRYTENSPEIIICRTRLGLFFPSLRYLTLEDTPVLRPDRLRKLSGGFIMGFLVLFVMVIFAMVFENPETRAPHILVSSLLLSVFLVAIVWIGLKIEYGILTRGIRKFIRK